MVISSIAERKTRSRGKRKIRMSVDVEEDRSMGNLLGADEGIKKRNHLGVVLHNAAMYHVLAV